MRVKGREYEGIGEAVTDETEVVRVLARFLQMQPGYGKFVGVKRGAGGRVDPSMVEEAARRRVVVRVRPAWARVVKAVTDSRQERSTIPCGRDARQDHDIPRCHSHLPAIPDENGCQAAFDRAEGPSLLGR